MRASSRTAVSAALSAEPSLADPGERMRGHTAGLVVLGGFLGANVANAAFHLISARQLGPTRYGDLASLVALIGLVSFPLAGVQFGLAQQIAHAAAQRNTAQIAHLYRRAAAWAGVGGVTAVALVTAVAPALRSWLHVASVWAVVLAAFTLGPTIVAPVIAGLTQGLERYVLFSASQVAGPLVRVLLLIPFVVVGAGVVGALGATFAGTVIAVGGTAWILGGWLRRPACAMQEKSMSEGLSGSLVAATVGILALTSLTTVDILVAKISFPGHTAGLYGAASIVGRLILLLPTSVASVMLPKVSSRAATGRETSSVLWPSLVATGVLCALLAVVYAVAPSPLIDGTFGASYNHARVWLWMFGVEMTLFALANVIFVYDLGRGRGRGAVLLSAAAVLQLVSYGAWHGSPVALLTVNIATASALLVTYLGLIVLARLDTARE